MATWVHNLLDRAGLGGSPRIRRIVVAVIGTTVVLFGLIMIVLPGPAILVVPLGLAILASEFAWARRVVRRGKLFVGRIRRGRSVRAVDNQTAAR